MPVPIVDLPYVERFLRKRWPENILAVARVEHASAHSAAFRFTTKANDYVVRFNNSFRGFETDACIYNHFGAKVAVPKTHLMGIADESLYFSITQRARGQMSRYLSEAEQRLAFPSLLEAYDAIHEIVVDERVASGLPVAGFSLNRTWRETLRAGMERLETAYRDTSQGDELSNFITAGDLMKLYWDLTELCPDATNLIHGDLSSANVFVDGDGVVTAIIDWNLSRCGDPLWDLARMSILGRTEWITLVLDEHRRRRPTIPDFDERFKCYAIAALLSVLSYFVKRGWIMSCRGIRQMLLQALRGDFPEGRPLNR